MKSLQICFRTWNKKDANIFNYDDKDITLHKIIIKYKQVYYCRDKNNIIKAVKDHYYIEEGQDIFFKLRYSEKKNYYEIISPIMKNKKYSSNKVKNLNNDLWLVLNSSNNNAYNINNDEYHIIENDIIRLGEKIYEAIKVNLYLETNNFQEKNSISYKNSQFGKVFNNNLNKNQYFTQTDEEITENTIDSISSNIESSDYTEGFDIKNFCRICFSKHSTLEDPKLKICKCDTYIHYNCLKTFLRQNIKIRENEKSTVTSYYCERFNCEVCEKPYPLRFTIKFEDVDIPINYYLIDGLELPEDTNYMILESLTYVKNNKNLKNIYVIKLTGDDVTIGRNYKNDIIDTNLSISRFHGILKFNKKTGNITLENLGKFGTLVLVKDKIKLNDNKKIYLQVGRTFIEVEQKAEND